MESEELATYLKENLSYDPTTGFLNWKVPYKKRSLNTPVGTLHSSGYLLFSAGFSNMAYSLRVHRVCWFLYYGKWPSCFIDHIDGDRINNKLDNLREASFTENAQNSKKAINNNSGFRGVSWCKERGKWSARIRTNGKYKYLGRFDCPTVAALAYDKASLKYHGDFGKRNFL